MGLGDLFKKMLVCPECRSRGAVKLLTGKIRCPNRTCKAYDASVTYRSSDLSSRQASPRAMHRGTFAPGANAVTVFYRNFHGDDTEYVGDRMTIRSTKQHLSIRVAPTGVRIALAKKFVKNLDELTPPDAAENASLTPTAVERQVLAYHTKHGTTSPRYEAIRRQYPYWEP